MLKPRSKTFAGNAAPITPMSEDPRHREAAARLRELEERLAATELRRKRNMARNARRRANPTPEDKSAWAAQLVAGGVVPGSDPATEIDACNVEFSILMPAVQAAHEKLREVENLLSYEACMLLQDAHFEALGEIEAALVALAKPVAALHVLRAKLLSAGYEISTSALPMPGLAAAYALGDPAVYGGQAHQFVRDLRKLEAQR
jgi:hypothetical protein